MSLLSFEYLLLSVSNVFRLIQSPKQINGDCDRITEGFNQFYKLAHCTTIFPVVVHFPVALNFWPAALTLFVTA